MSEPIDVLIPPDPDVPPAKPPKRPTTRAGRRAAAAAKQGADKAPTGSSANRPRKATLENRLTDSLVMIGTGVMAAGAMTSPAVQADGLLVVQHAPSVAAALDGVAKQDPKVQKALERMLTAGVYGGLAAAVAPLMIGIAANHKLVPPELAAAVGVTLPELPDVQPPPSAPPPAGASPFGVPPDFGDAARGL